MGNCSIRFTETFNTFGLLKIYGFNDLKLSSVEVYYYQTCKFVILGENLRQKRTKNDRFKHTKTIIFA